ncbi:MAG: adenylate/guanylate cyclase domain-containing protein [Comamonadaceae bacterium]|nr:MAG: adenylate/guanylate cyclase domain-containing protein [Comamonadaceae bacterium]
MQQESFNAWLTRRSWQASVRYCRVAAWLVLPTALVFHGPHIRSGTFDPAPRNLWLVAWQLLVVATCLAVLAVDRWLPRLRSRELPLYLFCGIFMGLTTWAGVRGTLIGSGGLVVYAAGSTFMAAVICTPRRVRRPLYALSLLALAIAAAGKADDAGAVIWAMALPFCVTVLSIELEKFTFSNARELYDQRQAAVREHARADKVLYNVLPASIADELKRNDRVDAVKFENMGVLFADIAGFTNFSRALPPDALVLVLNQIFSTFDALVERHGLEKIKTIGDAYMVVSHHRLDAMGELALEMVDAMAAYNRANGTQLGMRIGIHAGPAVAGVIGVKRFLYDVWGDTVNVASRMESTGEPGAVHVTDAVYAQTREHFAFKAREPVAIKGRESLPTYWLLGRSRTAANEADAAAVA